MLRFENVDLETAALDESFLCSMAAEFSRLIGLPKTLALCAAFGGVKITFPQRRDGPGAETFVALADVIGDDAVRRLASEYLGVCIYIPRCHRALVEVRNRQIVAEYTALISKTSARQATNQLAVRFRVSAVTIEKIVNGKHEISPPGARKP